MEKEQGDSTGDKIPQNNSVYLVVLVTNFWKSTSKFLKNYLLVEAKF